MRRGGMRGEGMGSEGMGGERIGEEGRASKYVRQLKYRKC